MIKNLLLVGLGGGVGSIFRYLTSIWIVRLWSHNYPFATFIVNITGCFLIGIFIGISVKGGWIDRELRLLLITGFCGGYTTFSAFSAENMQLLELGHYTSLVIYILSSVVVGVGAVWAGLLLTK